MNLQIELALSDQSGAGAVEKKIVSMMVADRAWGRVRATAPLAADGPRGPSAVRLNVDAHPIILPNDAVRLELTLEYQPPAGSASNVSPSTPLNESFTVILQSGKPLLVSRAADPVTERRVTVEVTVTVMK